MKTGIFHCSGFTAHVMAPEPAENGPPDYYSTINRTGAFWMSGRKLVFMIFFYTILRVLKFSNTVTLVIFVWHVLAFSFFVWDVLEF